MFVDKVCERSWQSMKAQFLKYILPNIEKFDLSSEELLKFKKCEQQTRINKDAKGKVVPGHRGWRRNGRYYTVEDDKKLLEYITTKGRHHQTNGVKLWKMMELRNVLPERSWQSMKERYRKVIQPNLQRYDLSKDDYAKLRGLTIKDTNSKTSTVPTTVPHVVPSKKKHQLHTRGNSPYVKQTYGDAAESMNESFESISPSSADSTTRGDNMISTPTRKAFRALYEKAGKKLSSLTDKSVSNTLSEKPEETSPVKSTGNLNTVCSTPIRSPVHTRANTPSNQMNSYVELSPSHSRDGKAKTPEDPPPVLEEVSPNDSCNKSSSHSKLDSKQLQSCRDLSPTEHSPVVVEKGNTSKHDMQLSVSVNISDSNKNVACSQNISPSGSDASTVINESLIHEEAHLSQITSRQKSHNLDIVMQEEGKSKQLVAEGSNKMQMPTCVDITSRSNCDKEFNVKSPFKRKDITPEERKKSKEWMRRMLMRQKIVMTPRPPFLRRNTLLDGNKNVSKKDMKKRKKEKKNHVNDGKTLCGDEQTVSMNSKEENNENGKTSTGSKVVPKVRRVSGKLKKSADQKHNHNKRRKILAGDLTKKQNKQVINKSSQDIAGSATRATSRILVRDLTKKQNEQVINKSSQNSAESVSRGTSESLVGDLTKKQDKQAINKNSQDIAESVTRATSEILAGDLTKKQDKQTINKNSQDIAESVTRATSEILAGDLTKKQDKQAINKNSQDIAESVTRVTGEILAGELTKKQDKQAINKNSQDIAENVTLAASGEDEDRTIHPVETNQPLEESELPPCLNNEQGLLHIRDH
ncbi:serine-rich adhesin for platelets [Anabrus simplex]|uniref:serine-rich adhesin for platelets n=1 Tax=Anabrus simplex TaxID=316456 RepID=UPI0035A27E68